MHTHTHTQCNTHTHAHSHSVIHTHTSLMVHPENQAKVLLKSSKGCIYMAWTDGEKRRRKGFSESFKLLRGGLLPGREGGGVIRGSRVLCYSLLLSIVLLSAPEYCAALCFCCAVLCSWVLCYSLLLSIVLFSAPEQMLSALIKSKVQSWRMFGQISLTWKDLKKLVTLDSEWTTVGEYVLTIFL